jgi:hypothetical protein
MNWAYVSGFFDGEGHVSLVQRGGRIANAQVSFTQKDRAVLEQIDSFLKSEGITATTMRAWTRKSAETKRGVGPYHALVVWRPDDVQRILMNMLPYLIVKRAIVETVNDFLLAFIEARRRHREDNFERNLEVGRRHLLGVSFARIADGLQISSRLVRNILKNPDYGCDATQARTPRATRNA